MAPTPEQTNNTTTRVAVVGGGVAGLATAVNLRDLATEQSLPLEVTVLDKGADAGQA